MASREPAAPSVQLKASHPPALMRSSALPPLLWRCSRHGPYPGIHPGRPAGPRSGVLLPRQPVAGGKNGSAYASRCRRDQPGRPIGHAQPIGRNVTKGRGPYDPAQSQEHLA
jgi:hypothetical protein